MVFEFIGYVGDRPSVCLELLKFLEVSRPHRSSTLEEFARQQPSHRSSATDIGVFLHYHRHRFQIYFEAVLILRYEEVIYR